MARILITGSAGGIGQMTARVLLEEGHSVVLHARNGERAKEAHEALPDAEAVLVADLRSISETRSMAESANKLGSFDAIIHNAGAMPLTQSISSDGISELFSVNVLAPYILTAMMERVERFIYIGSGAHRASSAHFNDLQWTTRQWNRNDAYAESKLYGVLLTFAVPRFLPNVLANAVSPGWVATRMGGKNATDDLKESPRTQAWLAVSNSSAAKVSGGYFFHFEQGSANEIAYQTDIQDRLLAECRRVSGISFPASPGAISFSKEA
ncbi:SDR family NAD(P)-dependent oxidoreductase [Solimicrobium silvestre]|uniref:Dehydrogenases with different specificities (Related to short-chain alcohol dehydrogenases) n=1 Tax=Solimicrobium silvestre TaxID=2099400 RepID=A0A2S9H3A8_9BURK|nr:SDR family NAD(P)-dependent oxidoreductase [Solimicrobium silvestre]PRC94346.1 Dehydrogenases with different specificities (related to short-chain alcohol dehydrogenases) [Solimicrobium silvestre]